MHFQDFLNIWILGGNVRILFSGTSGFFLTFCIYFCLRIFLYTSVFFENCIIQTSGFFVGPPDVFEHPDFSLWTSGFFLGTSGFFKHQDFFSTSRFFLNILIFGGSSGFYFWNLRIFFNLLDFWTSGSFREPPDFSLRPFFKNVRIFLRTSWFFWRPDLLENLRIFYVNVRIFGGTSGFFYLQMFWCMSGLLIYLRRPDFWVGTSRFSFQEPPDFFNVRMFSTSGLSIFWDVRIFKSRQWLHKRNGLWRLERAAFSDQ